MSYSPVVAEPVAELIWPSGAGASRIVRHLILAIVGSLGLCVAAKLQLPFHPVPMTLQTAMVFVIGMTMGPTLGMATVLLYLVEGALGFPVFAGSPEQGVGLAYMVGPTGGYLVGFVAAAHIVGWVTVRRAHWSEVAGGLLVATATIYLFGVVWLADFVGWEQAMATGLAPFLLGDLVKLILVTIFAETGLLALQRRLREA